jgi:hypothetical protein
VKIRDAINGAIIAMKNDILGPFGLIPITWDNNCYLINSCLREIIAPSITVLIKVERDSALLFRRQMSS